ncbi:hypothetical protein [Streptococcus gordonii]|uniref:hypothetical protein n=1 Tax=Streptococcus gordonii TaxID=1302 RepID=UPI0021AB3D26|nr:hypothetical protein [Streptococcus gordonii]
MSANVYDAAQFGHDFMEDPQMALTNLATSQMIGRTIGHLGNKYKAYRASQTGNVDIHSGEATSFKANIKERANTAWTDIKTKAGDVKVQAGEGFENFKNRVSNVKNQAISASTETLSNKVRNFSDAIETGRQNIHNTLDSLGNKNRLAFVTVDDVPVDLPKSKVSSKMDDFADRIQQISVDHKQKIEAFEGRGGGRSIPTSVNNMQEFFETDFGEQLKKSVRKTKKRYDGQAIYEVVDKSIPGLKKGDQIYLDGMHKDHLEVFKSNGEFKKVMNIDGTINKMKTKLGAGRRLNK